MTANTLWEKKLLPHSPLKQINDSVWIVEGTIRDNPMPRTMTIFKTKEGLILHSVVVVNDEILKQIQSLGKIFAIIVPNSFHRMDAPAYKEKFPEIKVISPKDSMSKVQKVISVDYSSEEYLPTLGVKAYIPPGLRPFELVYEVESSQGTTMIVTDIFFNMDDIPGFRGIFLKIIGSTGFLGMTFIGRTFILNDKNQFKTWIHSLENRPEIKNLIVAHGNPVTSNLNSLWKSIADRL
jgi:hypothetical protein